MTVLASSILGRVTTQLVDNGSTRRWSDAELLNWLSDGQRAIVDVVPVASQKVVTKALVAGVRQTLPSDGHKLIDITRNLSAGGVAGQAVLYIPRSLLDTQYPTWPTLTPVAVVKHWVYDEIDPAAFYVYPPNDGTGSLEINYSAMPPDLTATSNPIVVRDIFQTALFDYVMFRAHSKDSDYAAGQALAAGYMQSFGAFVAAQAAKAGA